MYKISDIIRNIALYCGVVITKKSNFKPIDLRAGSDPRSISYYCSYSRQIIIEADVNNGRNLEIFGLSKYSCNPYVRATKLYLETQSKSKVEQLLSSYYNLVQPKDIYSWLGIPKGEEVLGEFEPWATLLPWESFTPERKRRQRISTAKYDNSEHGAEHLISSGWRNFGPVREEIVELESERLCLLIDSIKKKGFINNFDNSGYIGAIVLLHDDGTWRWLAENGGQHRAAVLSSFGIDKVEVKVWAVVRRDEVSIWPGVTNGYYSVEQSLAVFDNIFHGDCSSILNNYKLTLNK